MNEENIEVSLIVPCFNEEKNIKNFVESVKKNFKGKISDYEIIFVNDGSKDNTLIEIEKSMENSSNIKLVNFSRNFGKEAAMYAGLEQCNGKYSVIIDADLQQDPKYIVEMKEILDSNKEYDEIAAYQDKRKEGKFVTILKDRFYEVMSKETGLNMKNAASDFRMFRKDVVNVILMLSEKSRFSKGIFSYVGFNIYYIPYEVKEREFGETKWNLKKLLKYALNGITDFSVSPLYIQLKFGLLTFVISIIMLIITCINNGDLYWKITETVLLIISIENILFGVTNFYIGKIFTEIKNRPIYIERKGKNK